MSDRLAELMDRILKLSDGTEARPGDGVLRARLAAALEAEAEAGAEPEPAAWAGYFAGTLDAEQRALIQRRIAASPALAAEAASMLDLLDQVAAHPAVVPADLAGEVAGLSRQAFTGRTPLRGLDRLASEQHVSRLYGALGVVLGRGRQPCEILLDAAASLVAQTMDAWRFIPVPSPVTRSGPATSASAEGSRDADAASVTVSADLFDGEHRIEVVVCHFPADQAVPGVLVADEADASSTRRLKPSIEAEPGGTLRLTYEAEDLAGGRYVVLIADAAEQDLQ